MFYSFNANEVDVKNNIYVAAFLFTIYCYIYRFICKEWIVIQLGKSQNVHFIGIETKYVDFVMEDLGIKLTQKYPSFRLTFSNIRKRKKPSQLLFHIWFWTFLQTEILKCFLKEMDG